MKRNRHTYGEVAGHDGSSGAESQGEGERAAGHSNQKQDDVSTRRVTGEKGKTV